MIIRFSVGDTLEMKKEHPCGERRWKVLRTGADFRIECTGCGHQVMLRRRALEKSVTGLVRDGEEIRDL